MPSVPLRSPFAPPCQARARTAAPRQRGLLGRPARRVGALRATARRRVHRPNNARVAIAADALDNFVAGVLSDAFFSQDPVDRPFLVNEAARRAGWWLPGLEAVATASVDGATTSQSDPIAAKR
jgi:hypothetical protein